MNTEQTCILNQSGTKTTVTWLGWFIGLQAGCLFSLVPYIIRSNHLAFGFTTVISQECQKSKFKKNFKILILLSIEKQMVPCKSTAKKVSLF